MSTDDWKPLNPPTAAGPRGADLPAYVSNGLIGLRVRETPLTAGMCIVSGFAGVHPERHVEASCPAPYPLAGAVVVNGLSSIDHPHAIRPLDQSYDFSTGELTTRFSFAPADVELVVEVVTFACRWQPAAVCQEVTITASGACDLGFLALIDPGPARGTLQERWTETPGEPQSAVDGVLLWTADGAVTSLGMALWTEARASARRTVDRWNSTGPLSTGYALRARAGEGIRFRQVATLVPSCMHAQPHMHALRLNARAQEAGFTELRRRNRDIWRDLWRGRIRLIGADRRWQALADAAFFYLNSSVHGSSPSSTSIFGLAAWPDYNYYFGHVMWDIDAFCTPVLNVTQPSGARALLDFRRDGMGAARDHARLYGLSGLQFPWEAAPSSGHEATPGAGTASWRELHGSLHVARAFDLHASATGDARYRREAVWPVVSGVADWVMSRSEAKGDQLGFKAAGGPAETESPVDDDALTIMASSLILRTAARLGNQTGEPIDDRWLDAAERLKPPMNREGVIISHAGYRRDEEKAATPSPLLALFPYNIDIASETARKTLTFYLNQWQDYVGSPMLPALYVTWACMAGDRELALTLLEEGYGAYDYGRFHQCLEYRLDKGDGEVAAGPFMANIGGFLSSLIFGLPGLAVGPGEPDTWPSRPVVLPAGWDAIEIEALHVRGRRMRLSARQGAERAELTWVRSD